MTLQLEVGRTYRSRDGEDVTIAQTVIDSTYPFADTIGIRYMPNGKCYKDLREHAFDLVEETVPSLSLCAGPGWKLRSGEIVTLRATNREHYPWGETPMGRIWDAQGRRMRQVGSYETDIVGRDLTAVSPDHVQPPAIAPQPERVKILHEGAALTSGARDAEYGPPQVNMHAAGKLKQLARELATRDITPAEWEALDMAMTKLSRLLVGTAKRDTYVDMAAYVAIAGEIALSI